MTNQNDLGAYMHPCEACNGTGTEDFEYGKRYCSQCEGTGIEPEPPEVYDEATFLDALKTCRHEECTITFADGATYRIFAGELLEVFAKAHELDEIARDEKRFDDWT